MVTYVFNNILRRRRIIRNILKKRTEVQVEVNFEPALTKFCLKSGKKKFLFF